ncbi:6-phosphogluconolactonase [Bacteroidales bacterium 6E]|nr:6-phosphogluconolactonase [Bacteroidales bacterium 6E]
MKEFTADHLQVKVFDSEQSMGNAAARFVTVQLARTIGEKGKANLILATGTSQFSFLDALKREELDWSCITVFHLDEYLGLPISHPASFRKYLKERILDEVNPAAVHLINGDAQDSPEEVARYEALLKSHPVDVACIGIGENGHIAFNDPPVADFQDPRWVKVVELDEACRRQQLGEGWFPDMASVPTHAMSLTIPAIMASKVISCVVPGSRKSEAVRNTLYGAVETSCPASILRRHPQCTLFLDAESYPV